MPNLGLLRLEKSGLKAYVTIILQQHGGGDQGMTLNNPMQELEDTKRSYRGTRHEEKEAVVHTGCRKTAAGGCGSGEFVHARKRLAKPGGEVH